MHGGCHDTLLTLPTGHVNVSRQNPGKQGRQNMPQKIVRQYKYVAQWCLINFVIVNTSHMNVYVFLKSCLFLWSSKFMFGTVYATNSLNRMSSTSQENSITRRIQSPGEFTKTGRSHYMCLQVCGCMHVVVRGYEWSF